MKEISKILILIMKIGGIANIILSPVWAVLYQFIEPLEKRPIPADPFWLFSFYFCTTIFGFMYYRIATDPVKYYPFIPVAIAAKTWGIGAIFYAIYIGYGWIPLAGIYDVIFLVFFLKLFHETKALSRKAA